MVEAVNDINNHLMQTQLNLTGLFPYEGELPPPFVSNSGDDGFKTLTVDQYLRFRVSDQIDYYERNTQKLGNKLKKLYRGIYIFGGVGTLPAAIGLELWVALTTSLAGVYTTYMESQQIESIVIMYNQSAASLMEIKSGWEVLPLEERRKQDNVMVLLKRTEDILLSEHRQWLRQMDDRTKAGDGR
ncbi:MAG: SLATT domain-containing protein [bacterium]|nr:SLATT domain-containing protein [bacterium]